MGKKKKSKLFSVLAVIEGEKREVSLLKCLKEIYLDEKIIKFKEDPISGGNPDGLINKAKKQLHFNFNRIFVWLDEDTDINQESRENLFEAWKVDSKQKEGFLNCSLADLQQLYNEPQRLNPILIVSQPICVESLILKVLGKDPCHSSMDIKILKKQKRELKSSLAGILGKSDEYNYYKQNISQDILEIKRKEIKELDLLISMLLI